LPNTDTHGEAATRNASLDDLWSSRFGMNEDLNSAMSIHLRASLVPAAAVIPAQGAYTDVVAVKKLVVHGPDKGVLPEATLVVAIWGPISLWAWIGLACLPLPSLRRCYSWQFMRTSRFSFCPMSSAGT